MVQRIRYTTEDHLWAEENVHKHETVMDAYKAYIADGYPEHTYSSFYQWCRNFAYISVSNINADNHRDVIQKYVEVHTKMSSYQLSRKMNDDGYFMVTTDIVAYYRKRMRRIKGLTK